MKNRVLLVELEGASRELLEALASRSVMPHVGTLLETGSITRLVSPAGLSDEAIRATLYTGSPPTVHGMLDDRYLDARQGRLLTHPVPRGSLANPFHALLSGATGVSPVPFAKKHWRDASGTQELGTAGQASSGTRKISNRETVVTLDDFDTAAIHWQDAPGDLETLQDRVAATRDGLKKLGTQAVEIDRRDPWRLMHIRIRTLQGLGHHLGNALQTNGPPGANPAWIGHVDTLLRAIDDLLGELHGLAQRRGATFFLVSMRGSVPFRGRITVSELLLQAGLLRFRTGLGMTGYRIGRWSWKIRRSILKHSSSSRPVGTILPIDWRRSRAVALHGHSAALVYLNTPERFGTRVLTTEAAQAEAAEAVVEVLRQAKNPVDGQPLFADVFKTEARFGPAAVDHGWPEVMGVPVDGFQTRHRPDRKGRLVRADRRQTAISGGPGILVSCPNSPPLT